ncbi:hypothetical protein RB195_009547 [Necator americanus]|uniref:C2H2-type domain-containing protein n=1 Tax=Necator americanus TaxID=51031 RepID=A0ABR1CTT9_NECAM
MVAILLANDTCAVSDRRLRRDASVKEMAGCGNSRGDWLILSFASPLHIRSRKRFLHASNLCASCACRRYFMGKFRIHFRREVHKDKKKNEDRRRREKKSEHKPTPPTPDLLHGKLIRRRPGDYPITLRTHCGRKPRACLSKIKKLRKSWNQLAIYANYYAM